MVGVKAWHGVRVTLNCGHLGLREVTSTDVRIGGLTACDVCPLRGNPRPFSQARQIVNIEPLELPRAPEFWAPDHWH